MERDVVAIIAKRLCSKLLRLQTEMRCASADQVREISGIASFSAHIPEKILHKGTNRNGCRFGF